MSSVSVCSVGVFIFVGAARKKIVMVDLDEREVSRFLRRLSGRPIVLIGVSDRGMSKVIAFSH